MTSFTAFDLEVIRATPTTLRVADPSKNGVAVNMTGATLRFIVKWRPADTDAQAIFTRTTGGGGITTTATTIDVAFVKTNTETLPYTKVVLYYELCYLSGSEYEVILKGNFIVWPNINRT